LKPEVKDKEGIPPDQQTESLVLKENTAVVLKRAKGSVSSIFQSVDTSTESSSSNEYTVFVNFISGKLLTLKVKPTDTIEDLKVKILAVTDIPTYQLKLIFNEVQLDDKVSLQDVGVRKHDLISVVLTKSFPLYVAHSKKYGEFIIVDVEASDTIDSVKEKIREHVDIPPAQIRLRLKEYLGRGVFGGRELIEGTLSDYGINAENYEILMTHGPDVRRR
jgi:ubiquitin C